MDYTNHWNNLYSSKKLEEVSWYQKTPQTSLDFIYKANLSKDDAIIDPLKIKNNEMLTFT